VVKASASPDLWGAGPWRLHPSGDRGPLRLWNRVGWRLGETWWTS